MMVTADTVTPTGRLRDEAFKVLIVGAGVGGLTLAHCLHKAGIDFIVLDKHPIAPPWGGSITIHPSSSRILDQLGILGALEEKCTPMHDFWNRDPSGKDYLSGPFFDHINKRTGYLTYTLERRQFLQTLYDTLPSHKTKVLPSTRLINITTTPSQITAHLSNGTTHTADLLIGADGVHSTVRALMWSLATTTGPSPSLIPHSDHHALETTYNCLVGVTPYQPGFGLGTHDMTSITGHNRHTNLPFSILLLTQPHAIFFIVHCKLPPNQRTTASPNHVRVRYTPAEADAKAAELADCRVSETLTFGDIWSTRTRGQLVSLEEGVLKQWFCGRVVLLGDAAHKVTPNAAFGGNLAVEDAVGLANEIVGLVRGGEQEGKRPLERAVEAALGRYQGGRLGRTRGIYRVSWVLTRLQAWDGWVFWVVQRWILPIVGLEAVAAAVARACSEAPKLWYIPFQEKTGTLLWKKYSPHPEEFKKSKMMKGVLAKKLESFHRLVVPVVLSSLLVYVAVVWGFATRSVYF